jgi:hypothetical protein
MFYTADGVESNRSGSRKFKISQLCIILTSVQDFTRIYSTLGLGKG